MHLTEDLTPDLLDAQLSIEELTERVFRTYLPSVGLTVREPQVAMGKAIARQLDAGGGKHLAIEAPTGSGKGLGYLVPTVLAAMRRRLTGKKNARVVVSTSAIPLQRQLVSKDVPLLAKALGLPVTAAVVKGKSNYVCLLRLEEEAQLISHDHPVVKRIERWASDGTGDREDLPFEVEGGVWSKVSTSSDECLGPKCPHYNPCLAERAKRTAREALVVVMNHNYLTLAGNNWGKEGAAVALVCDEGHDLEDAARRASGSEIRQGAPKYWASVVDKAVHDKGAAADVADGLTDLLGWASKRLGGESSRRLQPGWAPSVTRLPDLLVDLSRRAGALVDSIAATNEVEAERQKKRAERLDVLATRVRNAINVPKHLCVWAQKADRGTVVLSQAPIRATAPTAFRPLVLTSATLGGGNPLDAAEALSLKGAEAMLLPPAWPVDRMAVIWVPEIGDPKDGGWANESARATVDFVQTCKGGVLVLATSWARMRDLAQVLRQEIPYNVLVQGEAGRSELLQRFAEDVDSVLVGSRSMFQGVDVPGNACRGVVIDRVPFPSPGDPMEQAIAEDIEAQGGDAFRDRSLRVASQLLRQAVGRLIRSETDRGAVAILDTRIVSSRMASTLQRAVSPYPLTRHLSDVAAVLAGGDPVFAIPTRDTLPLGGGGLRSTIRSARRAPAP